ncbi:MAG: Universal stress protein [Acidobacteria bacterium]|nr:Universal stress protein [Acidobacteriota bacterium]
MNILLGVDGSDYSLAAADMIASLPWPPNSAVKILSAVKLPFRPTAETRSLPESHYSQIETAMTEQANAAINMAQAQVNATNASRKAPLTITTGVIIGHPQEVILSQAEECGADLIALGSRGLGGFKRFLLGSVSGAVAARANCSVMIVRADEKRPIRNARLNILLAVDGSAGSDAAVNEIANRPWPEGAAVKVIAAAEPPQPPIAGSLILPGSFIQGWEKAIEDQARAAMEKASERLRASGQVSHVLSETIPGSARDVILDEAEKWGADLIVLGSRGLGGFDRLLLGSVSQAVASHAKCSVEIVR